MSGFGIDLGTANTVVCHERRGIVLDEPSVMAVRSESTSKHIKPLLVGREARELVGRCPVGLATIRPLQDGVVVDLELARAFIVAILSRVSAAYRWGHTRPHAVIGVPMGATSLERRALLEAADEAGIKKARLIPEPIAGAVGCGINPLEPRAHMVVDIGGGTSEVTAFCFGGVLAHRSSRVAGDEMTLALYQYLRSEHQLIVGELTAESVKCQVGLEDSSSLVVQGLDAATGRPRLVTVSAGEVVDALKSTVEPIIATLAQCFEDLPPQAVNDILEEGVWAFGGGSLLRGFDKLLESAFSFPVRVAERPLTCVSEGAATSIGHPEIHDAFDGDITSAM